MNYLIFGSSYTLIEEEIKKIAQDKPRDIYYLDEVELGEILEDLGYSSMFDDDKVIILKNFEVLGAAKKEQEKILEKLQNYLESPNPNIILIFTSNEKISGSRGPLKSIVAKLKVIATPIICKPYELAKLLESVIKEKGLLISSATLNTFSEKCASNYDVALRELQKLEKVKTKDKLIKDEDIEKYVSNYNTSDVFGLKDAIVGKNIKKASEMIDDLESSKIEIIPLVVMLAKEYQLIYNIKLMTEKKFSNDKISADLGGVHPYRVKLLREASSKYTTAELERIILELCNMDLRLVSEDNLGYDELRKLLVML